MGIMTKVLEGVGKGVNGDATKSSTAWLKGGWWWKETRQMGATTSQGPTGLRFLRGKGLGPSQLKGAVDRRRHGRR